MRIPSRCRIDSLTAMKALNYRHLRYFYTVAKTGGVSAAARSLNVAQPTVSTQLKQFEKELGVTLVQQLARGSSLTPAGRAVLQYAESIFALGDELLRVAERGDWVRGRRIQIGISNLLPKMIIPHVLGSGLQMDKGSGPELVFRVDSAASLAAELNRGSLDVVLTDSAVDGYTAEVLVHHLSSSAVSIFARRDIVQKVQSEFPQSLDGEPFLMPSRRSAWGRALEAWFARLSIKPRVIGEFDDNAMMKNFGRLGFGAFPGITTLAAQISHQYEVEVLGTAEGVQASVYALTRRAAAPDADLSRFLNRFEL